MNVSEICDVVRETGCAIHRHHRKGRLEKMLVNFGAPKLHIRKYILNDTIERDSDAVL